MKISTFISVRWRAMMLASSVVSLLSACSYEAAIPCDLPQQVTYQMDVLPILKANCYRCHSADKYQGSSSSTLNMEKFSELQVYTLPASGHDGVSSLLGNIRHDPGFVNMPFDGGKLGDCEIAIIKAWIDQGAPQN